YRCAADRGSAARAGAVASVRTGGGVAGDHGDAVGLDAEIVRAHLGEGVGDALAHVAQAGIDRDVTARLDPHAGDVVAALVDSARVEDPRGAKRGVLDVKGDADADVPSP